MKKLILLTVACTLAPFLTAQTPCSNGMAGGFPCDGITLQSHLTIAQMGGQDYGGSNPAEATDSWGWTDPLTNKEYAIVGMNDQTAFVDISNPNNPVYLGKLDSYVSGRTSWWRDIKTYQNYAFIVSDNNRDHGMQVFDLENLRGLDGSPVVDFTEDNHLTWGSGPTKGMAHNIIINEVSGFAYILGSSVNAGRPLMVDISDPLATLSYTSISSSIGGVNIGYCHDAQVIIYNGPDTEHQGKELMIGAFSGSQDFVRIIDVSNKNNLSIIGNIDYSNKFYTHQGWFTEDQRFFIVGDELDETNGPGFNTRTLIFDMQDLDNPVLHYTHYGETPAIDHNGYVKGNRFYLANYKAGMRVFKIDELYNVASPSMEEVEFFDSHPSSDSADYHGAWNVYPFFESGNVIISDLDEGLFVVRDPNYDTTPPVAIAQNYVATLENSGSVTVTSSQVASASTDNVAIIKSSIDGLQSMVFTCDDVGDIIVLLEVEDDYGLKDTVQTTITIEPNETLWDINTDSWDDGTPGPGSYARIATTYSTAAKGSIDACTCSVDVDKILYVGALDYINIQKDITINGSLIVEHTGNVVQQDEDAQVIKNGNISVRLVTPVLDPRDFMIMGSPMTTQNETVYNDPYQLLEHTTENFDPYSGDPAVNGVNFLDDDTNDFTPHTGVLNPGEGYLVRPSYTLGGSYNYSYELGTLNSGPITYDAFYGSSKEDSPNILSNPYASAMDASLFITENPAVSEVYFWEHNITPSAMVPGPDVANFSMEDVSLYNGTMGVAAASGGSTPNGVIATGEGFVIKANNPGGTITFTNAMRLKTGNTTLRTAEEQKALLWISLNEATYELSSNTGIGFIPAATDGYDVGFDSKRLGTVISLFSHIDDGTEQLGIQGLSDFDVNKEISMGFETLIENDAHEYTVSLDNFEGDQLENVYVFLLDRTTGIVTNLSKSKYEFTASNGIYNNRFSLYFRQKTFGIDNAPMEAIILYPNPVDTIFTIISPLAQIKSFNFYDARGRRVIKIIEQTDASYTLDIAALETGIYYIEVVTDSGTITKKIIKN
jgi:choice-of-anchor B domain-containing protein